MAAGRRADRLGAGCDPPADCACLAAVLRAHAGMIASGAPASVALDAAVRVYRYHHPACPPERARDLVETWVFNGPLH